MTEVSLREPTEEDLRIIVALLGQVPFASDNYDHFTEWCNKTDALEHNLGIRRIGMSEYRDMCVEPGNLV